jgi:hypothetical protein
MLRYSGYEQFSALCIKNEIYADIQTCLLED